MREEFRFYVDDMPDWFCDKVTANEIILNNCDYKRWSINDSSCKIKTENEDIICRGSDFIVFDGDNIHIETFKARKIALEIIEDISGRNGLGDEWDMINDDIKFEILTEWIEKIDNIINKI